MADKVTLDFETGMITWDMESQKGTEYCLDLAERKEKILEAMGYKVFDISRELDAVNDFINGRISAEEFSEKLKWSGKGLHLSMQAFYCFIRCKRWA